jgi:DNA polymerase-1
MDRATAIEYAKILHNIIEIGKVSTILDTFMYAFIHRTVKKKDGLYYLFGNFNLGGTLSGRLSSSNINLQNLPSTGSQYAEMIKECFISPDGWLMCGADFYSLEDRISALTTKDPNKLKVYTDGYDGHCLRTFTYFPDKLPGIINTVASINSIEKLFPKLRQISKGPTFCLTYQGTFIALMGLGFTKEEAKNIELNYHNLYAVSDAWVYDKMLEASTKGYTTLAFGLRLRTPILGQTILGGGNTPYEAASEGRTMGNALGQSYGMLNNRAAIEYYKRLMKSPYKYDVKPISHIHDAQYFLVRNNVNIVKWHNDNLIECMEWQNLPEITHPTVKLGGNPELYYPHWAAKVSLPNKSTTQEIISVCKKHLEKLKEKKHE